MGMSKNLKRATCGLCCGKGWLWETAAGYIVQPEDVRALLAEECELAGLELGDVIGPRRFKRLVEARDRIAYRLRYELDMPLKTIGAYLGNRDHSTIIHSLEKTERLSA